MVLDFNAMFPHNPTVSDGGSMSVLEQGGIAATALVSTPGSTEPYVLTGSHSHIFDGDSTTSFQISYSHISTCTIYEYITLTFPNIIHVSSYFVYWGSGTANPTITSWLQYSSNGTDWTNLIEKSGAGIWNTSGGALSFKYFRIMLRSVNGGADGTVSTRFYIVAMTGK